MARGLIDVFRDWKQNKQDKQELGTETKKEKDSDIRSKISQINKKS